MDATPASAPTDSDLVAGLRLTAMRLSRRLRKESGDDITPSQLAILATAERYGPLTLGRIAEVEGVQPPTVTRIVGWLEAESLVRLAASTEDRRAKVVTVTAKGSKRLERIRSNRNAWLACRLDELTPAERAIVAEALPVLEKLLGEQP
jgi:DNA-binding MarR family transcriptional regulator